MPAHPLLPFQCLLFDGLRGRGEPCPSFRTFKRYFIPRSTVRRPVTEHESLLTLFVIRIHPFWAVDAEDSLVRKNGIRDLAKDLQFIETVQGGEVRHLSTHAETSTVHCPHGSDHFPEMLHVLCGGIPQLTKRPSNK